LKKVLLGDANFCVLPLVEVIKKKKHHLSVVGSLLSDPAHAIADNSVPLDYSDINSLYTHMMNSKYDYILPGCNDQSYVSLAYIAEKLHFKGFDPYETVLKIHHKDKFKELAKIYNYPVPKYVNKLEEVHTLKFPIIIKPVDSFSGKGISRVESDENIEAYWKLAEKFSGNSGVVAEEFIEGKLYSHSAFIKNKKIIIDFFVNEYCTVYPYQVNSSNLSVDLNKTIQNNMRVWVEQFAKDLDLVDGLIHTQFISDNNVFYILEVARRCPGDLYSQLIQKSTGVNYSELYAIPFLNEEISDKVQISNYRYFSRHTVSVEEECIFISSNVKIASKSIQNIQLKKSGEILKPAPFGKSGIYFIEHYTEDDMKVLTSKLKDYIFVEVLDIEG